VRPGDGSGERGSTDSRVALPREPYIDARHLAARMGVSVRTVKRWTAEGMPSETWGMRVRRYLASEAIAWARARGLPSPATTHGQRRLMSAVATHREE
jgi:hypothetical protein